RFLGSPIMVKIGGISFGIYLWHWVLLAFYRYNVQEIPGLFVGILIIVVSIILSFIMTKLIEEPIRKTINDKFAFKRLALMGAFNLVLISTFMIGNTLEQKKLRDMVADEEYPGAMAIHDHIDVPDMDP